MYKDMIGRAKEIANVVVNDMNNRGGVGCVLITSKGNIYEGRFLNAHCGLSFCAEVAAIAAMITKGETRIDTLVAVAYDGTILPPCGRCRELIYQVNKENLATKVVVSRTDYIFLSALLNRRWQEAWEQNENCVHKS